MAKLKRSGGQAPVSEDASLRVRAAWLYYNQGLTQKDVSDRLGVSRGTIIRILAEAVERGDVQILINAREAECVDAGWNDPVGACPMMGRTAMPVVR